MTNYKSTTEEGECIFCKIVSGDIKTPGIFWEDDEFMAFLSTYPNMEGVSAVIPKKHYGSDVLQMPNDILQRFILATKIVSKKLMRHFNDVGRIGLIMEGTGINHAHIKLYPMHGTGYMKKGEWKQCLSDDNKFFKTYEGYLSSNDGPEADPQELRELAKKLKET